MRVPHHKHVSDADKFKETELSDPYGIMRATPRSVGYSSTYNKPFALE